MAIISAVLPGQSLSCSIYSLLCLSPRRASPAISTHRPGQGLSVLTARQMQNQNPKSLWAAPRGTSGLLRALLWSCRCCFGSFLSSNLHKHMENSSQGAQQPWKGKAQIQKAVREHFARTFISNTTRSRNLVPGLPHLARTQSEFQEPCSRYKTNAKLKSSVLVLPGHCPSRVPCLGVCKASSAVTSVQLCCQTTKPSSQSSQDSTACQRAAAKQQSGIYSSLFPPPISTLLRAMEAKSAGSDTWKPVSFQQNKAPGSDGRASPLASHCLPCSGALEMWWCLLKAETSASATSGCSSQCPAVFPLFIIYS